jgi:hypothetical protein
MDQTKVTSGFDLEVAIGGGYLTNLLLLAGDVGILPTESTFGADPVVVRVQQPPGVDRTYPVLLEAIPPEVTNRDDAFEVTILHGPDADIKVLLRLHLSKASTGEDIEGVDVGVFLKLGLLTAPRTDGGPGLESAAITTTLVDVDGLLVVLAEQQGTPKNELMDALRPTLERTLGLDSLGSGGRVRDIALRKFEADADTGAPACLVLYVNLNLKNGPHDDAFVGNRGNAAAGSNALDPTADITVSTRPGLLHDFGVDAFHRRAVKVGGGFDHPVKKDGERIGKFVEIKAGPVVNSTSSLKIEVEIEIQVDWLPDPNIELNLFLSQSLDNDGIMDWTTDLETQAGLLAHIVIGLVSLALIPVIGPWALAVFTGLELALYAAQKIVDHVYDDKAERREDRTLLDMRPNRFTFIRRRWDPLFETQHQIGLRPGEALVTNLGMSIWGDAALTRAVKPVRNAVIVEAVTDADGKATALRYRVPDAADHSDLFELHHVATLRRHFEQHDQVNEPDVFTIPVSATLTSPGALERVVVGEVRGLHPYVARAVEIDGNQIERLLVINRAEHDEVRNGLIDAFAVTAEAQIRADQEAQIRADVDSHFAALGIFPTPGEVEAEVTARIQALVAVEVEAYIAGQLETDLDAALRPRLRFSLSPDELGRLQNGGLLELEAFDLIELRDPSPARFYYRDRYSPKDEKKPIPGTLADNLRSLPRFRTLADGTREFL